MADLRNFDEWDPGTVSAAQVMGGEPGLGAEYDLDVKGPVGNLAFQYVTTEFDPPHRFQRLWRFYLAYCEAAFRERHCLVVQVVIKK
jgi:cyclopropane fatty-acyl-phospholipid synthase-like methyltransferase